MKNNATYSAPKTIPRACYEKMFAYLKSRQEGYCPIAMEAEEFAAPTELHHAGIHNTEVNQARYPLVVHSLVNLIAVNHHWHMKRGSFGARPGNWAERMQRFLAKPHHLEMARWLNGF